jgi:hypothetical protein
VLHATRRVSACDGTVGVASEVDAMRSAKIVLVVVEAVLALASLGLVAAGGSSS